MGGSVLAVLLFIYIAYRCLPLSQEQVDDSAVTVRQQSYYQLEVDGRPAVYFSDYVDSAFVGGSVSSDSVSMRSVSLRGYWVNRMSVLPSCFGRIAIPWRNKPSTIVNLRSAALHRLLFRLFIKTDTELGGLQTQRNELSYYLRVHSVQDYGYNKIAAYHEAVVHKMDSIRKVMRALHGIRHDARLRVRQVNRYSVVPSAGKNQGLSCNRLRIYNDRDAVLLQAADGMTPFGVHTRLSVGRALDELPRHNQQSSVRAPRIPKGALPDSAGYYMGEQKNGRANGYGQYYGQDGSFYDGHWAEGRRNGFGIYIAPHEYLQVGEWKNDVFKGERLTYTADRIYGIDLSRHQHEQKNKYYDISWSKLRITDLGTLSSKTIKGTVDYPVSFAYVKSTEGCTVLNGYYASDYAAARRHGIRVGTYHFFSTTSAGSAQADYFLRHSRFGKGDLPPVLDVEPSDAQIARMGGAEAMFRSIRAWMAKVHKRTGRRPILYISQMFANHYMPLAPDLGDNYLVWIARYGEYKPDIKLAYWQLSPDGKVRGIHGDVDINVFNGYRNQYEEFLKRHSF